MKLLDEQIGTSELLMSIAPIRLITVGGSLAVLVCGNRESSYDIDCLLDPHVAAATEYAAEFQYAVLAVAENSGFQDDWLNQRVDTFLAGAYRQQLFFESIEQGIEVYSGLNLVVFSASLTWALERKIRRLCYSRDRRGWKDVDVPDAAALIRRIKKPGEARLSFDYLRKLNVNQFDLAPTDEGLHEVARYYAETYGEVGLAEMVWDEEQECTKYRGMNNEWVYCK